MSKNTEIIVVEENMTYSLGTRIFDDFLKDIGIWRELWLLQIVFSALIALSKLQLTTKWGFEVHSLQNHSVIFNSGAASNVNSTFSPNFPDIQNEANHIMIMIKW